MSTYQTRGNVKSAERALALLEYFDLNRKEANVTELCEVLEVPQSSMSMLLKSLCNLGYIQQIPGTRTYTPGYRAAFLGDWARSLLGDREPLCDKVSKMAKDLGETVVLAAQNGPYMQYVYVASARPVEQLRVRVGMKRLMVCTAAGRSLLMSLDDPQVRQIARRNNSEADDLHRVSETTLIDRIGEEKARGYSESQGGLVPGINSISTLLDRKAFGKCLAIGVGGRAANIEKIKPKALDYLEDIRSLG